MKPNINLRETSLEEDSLIARHFYQLWRDNDVPVDSIKSDWQEIILQFINHARQELLFKAFVAEVDNKVVGSASCQLFAGLYPLTLVEDYRKYGYIWGVYVEPPYRKQGIASRLTRMAIAHQKTDRLYAHYPPRRLGKYGVWRCHTPIFPLTIRQICLFQFGFFRQQ